jgi:uncharacterized NAD(P)/FAD-binding protein YdhS
MRSTTNSEFDLSFIGGGISCSAVLLHLLDAVNRHSGLNGKRLRIAVIEKEKEFWKGVAYGNRSLATALIITNCGEFVPPSEKQEFIKWLEENEKKWLAELMENGGATAANWYSVNQNAIRDRNWDEIYIPRYLFGDYMDEKINKLINQIREHRNITVDLIGGEAVDVNPQEESYSIEVRNNKGSFKVLTGKIVLSIGSPPFKEINIPGAGVSFVNIRDPYYPSMQENIAEATGTLTQVPEREKRNLFILGSNASSLELLYHFQSDRKFKETVNKIVILSNSGGLPYRITDGTIPGYTFENLEKLRSGQGFTSVELMNAIKDDLEIAITNGINVGDMYYQLSDLVVELLDKAGEKQKEHFHCFFGADFSKLIRRAGPEYRDAAAALEASGKLEMLKGSFIRAELNPENKNEVSVVYKDPSDGQAQTFPLFFGAVINCGGFEKLNDSSSSPLISNLLSKELCRVNCTNRGIQVNEKFEAAKGLYIMGPLLGGIFNNKSRLWHLENAKNIFHLSKFLSGELLSSFSTAPVLENNSGK